MDKSVAGLLAVASALAVPAHAATALPPDVSAAMRAENYSDLLKPIPNALAVLKASAQEAEAQSLTPEPLTETTGNVLEVQYWYHHHHHHHHWRRWWYRHHHHHHHHNS